MTVEGPNTRCCVSHGVVMMYLVSVKNLPMIYPGLFIFCCGGEEDMRTISHCFSFSLWLFVKTREGTSCEINGNTLQCQSKKRR